MKDNIRPDLHIPLYPSQGFGTPVRMFLLRRNGIVDFLTAFRLILAIAAITVMVAVVSIFLAPPWRLPAAACAAVFGICAGGGRTALDVSERRQHSFEREWVSAQTASLRRHAFEALRCTVRGRRYNLASPVEVRDLTNQPGNPRAAVAFTYLASDNRIAIDEVHRDLRDLTFVPGGASVGRAFASFPAARYIAQEQPRHRPAWRASWALDGQVLISVSADTDAADDA